MFALVKKIDQLIDRLDGSAFEFVCNNRVVVFFKTSEPKPASCAGKFSLAFLQQHGPDLVTQVCARLRQQPQKIMFKMCGQESDVSSIATLFAQLGLTFSSASSTQMGTRVRYHALNHSFRVDKQGVIGPSIRSTGHQPSIPPAAVATRSKSANVAPSLDTALTTRTNKTISTEKPSNSNIDRNVRGKIKVGIIDDARQIRYMLRKIISESPDFEIVWEAALPSEAMPLLKKNKPDVITLDLHMPEMNGVELLKSYIRDYPIPTIIISSLGKNESPLVFEALENGAVDYMQKPVASEFARMRDDLHDRLRAARFMRITPFKKVDRAVNVVGISETMLRERIVAIGASTGGTEALRMVLTQLPEKIPAILIVQHIPPVFSHAFAERLNSLCPFEVKEAADGDVVKPGRVLIAPGGKQMSICKTLGGYKVKVTDDAPVNRHKPSVDVLFNSVAESVLQKSIGIILTGMGADGAKGLKRLRDAGARTIAQNEETSVVFGMPKEAIKLSAAEDVLPLEQIGDALMKMFVEVKAAQKSA